MTPEKHTNIISLLRAAISMLRALITSEPRRRSRRACDSCKLRKKKCNGESPCKSCVQQHREAGCRFSRRSARLLKSYPKDTPIISSEPEAPCMQNAANHLICSPGSIGMDSEQQVQNEENVTVPVPKAARLLRDGEGRFVCIGDSAGLSFLQIVRRIIASSAGPCQFTEDHSRHFILEALQKNTHIQHGPLTAPPSQDKARELVHQFILVTNPLLDLFNLEDFYLRLATWVSNPSSHEAGVSAIFYLIIAIGTQVSNVDQTLAEQYFGSGYQLAFSTLHETPSIHTVQSYILISVYMLGACRRNGAFVNLGIAVRAAYAVGIHRKETNTFFNKQERLIRERVWRSLRMMDLFLSASLGQLPATSSDDKNIISDQIPSAAVTSLCQIFEQILTGVYTKQTISVGHAERISDQHRAWASALPIELRIHTERSDGKTLEGSLAASHLLGSYYWSIILLTRPFLVYRLSHHKRNKTDSASSSGSYDDSARIDLFADACVCSALRTLDVIAGLCHFPSLPRRLPFLINSVFNSAIVLGAAYFADYDKLLPLKDGMNKAEVFLDLFVPHDPHACRLLQIIKYLRAAVLKYVKRRNHQWIEESSGQVDQTFGHVGGKGEYFFLTPGQHERDSHTRRFNIQDQQQQRDQAAPVAFLDQSGAKVTSTTDTRSPYLTTQPSLAASDGLPLSSHDFWDALFSVSDGKTTLSYDALATNGMSDKCPLGFNIPAEQSPFSDEPSPISDVTLPGNNSFSLLEDYLRLLERESLSA
ncbi:Copper fist DNA-binding [Penicillium odoratum]|uniref:Copper fist DNA-binding n=1 Tax=Penicillium odoratum TaxID=1167516 RepID=UPI002546FA51|nr:Copper fist DNA-binding [Penicillium odoratum]KAJ5752645.1 Copper fist DNA-binding [Penicillium odoratum]